MERAGTETLSCRRPDARGATGEYALVVDGASKVFGRGGVWFPFCTVWGLSGNPRIPVYAVRDVSLRIRTGEIYGILGANGSGKSTLIRMISTLLLPDAGTLTVFGYDVVRQAHQVKRLINRVSVEASFFKKLSTTENLIYAARLYGLEPRAARAEIVRILDVLGIPLSRIDRPVAQMSRGMQQKVAIARAFLTAPVLLLLDEPTTGLDPQSKRDVQQFIVQLRAQHDATVVLTSHDMAEADVLCDRLAIFERGRILREGTPLGLKRELAGRLNCTDPPSLEEAFLALTGHRLEGREELGA